jgi:4-hydroxy-2-oxoheptanedioate aldolase
MRVIDSSPTTIVTYIDAGVGALIVPDITSAAHARAVVDAAFFAPIGHRHVSVGRSGYLQPAGMSAPDFYAALNRETLLAVQLESREAHDDLDAILAVEGLEYFGGGPDDLAQSLGVLGQNQHPSVRALDADMAERVQAAGKRLLNDIFESVNVLGLVEGAIAELLERHGRRPAFRF